MRRLAFLLAVALLCVAPRSAAAQAITAVSGSAASTLVVKQTSGRLWDVYANCTAICWLMVFNATAAPTNGATTAGPATTAGNMFHCVAIGANGVGTVQYQPGGTEFFSTGVVVMISSTACATLTASTVAFIHARVD